jgi:hypothetical protein
VLEAIEIHEQQREWTAVATCGSQGLLHANEACPGANRSGQTTTSCPERRAATYCILWFFAKVPTPIPGAPRAQGRVRTACASWTW